MNRTRAMLGAFLVLLLLGAASPAATSDRDLIIRLQGEIVVLQRQIRDLQETLDKNQASSYQVVNRVAENSETSGKILSSLQDRLNQTDTLQHNNLTGVVKRLAQLEETTGQSNAQLAEINRSLREIKAAIQRQAKPEPPPPGN
ncbi:MAG: hypothetical protein ABI882_05285 [Acidobacteriota bacterium]